MRKRAASQHLSAKLFGCEIFMLGDTKGDIFSVFLIFFFPFFDPEEQKRSLPASCVLSLDNVERARGVFVMGILCGISDERLSTPLPCKTLP